MIADIVWNSNDINLTHDIPQKLFDWVNEIIGLELICVENVELSICSEVDFPTTL